LGAGKTTLLNRILKGNHGLRVGVLVNDFGDINIDAALIEGVEENTISLANGCICCEIRDDLVASLEDLLTREQGVDYVIIEASGVAEPSGIAMTFVDQRYERLLRLDSITCIVDAEGIFADADNDALTMLKLRQIAFSDLVVLNKTDLVSEDHVEVIRDWIDLHMKRVRVVEAIRGEVPLGILLSAGRFDAGSFAGQVDREVSSLPELAGEFFSTWSYESEAPLSLDALRTMVRRELPGSVYRCKGILYTADEPSTRFALQTVGRRTEITSLGEWGDRPPRSQIVAIGSKDLEGGSLSALFDRCVAATVPPKP
jgi:G3E family GTPase